MSCGSAFTRSLAPLPGVLWALFVAWTTIVAAIWMTRWSEAHVEAATANAGLREAAVFVLRSADPIWLLLAAANLYLMLAERVGLRTARLWAVIILVTGTSVAWTSVHTGWPLGSVHYTTRLGPKLGSVPLGWPLWWWVVIIGGRMLAERLLPRASHGLLAVVTGAFALLTQYNLEPLAWKVRAFWLWPAGGTHSVPLQNYAVWWLVPTALAFVLREKNVAVALHPLAIRPAAILVFFNAVFVLTHLAGAFRD